MSDSLRSHELQRTRLSCPLPTPRVHSDSRPSSRWCHLAIPSSVVPFSSCPQSLPASGSFPMSQPFTWGGQSIEVSASTSVLPMNNQDWSPLGWLVGSPCSPRDSQESSLTPQFKSISSSVLSFLYSLTLTSIHDHWKNHSLDRGSLTWLLCPFKIHQPFKIPVSEGGDIYTHTADSHCCTAEINTTL